MSVIKTLRTKIAPELNHLYTVPPFQTSGGMDCGWYCREHALHTFFVAWMLGAEADIRTGDFAVLSPLVQSLTSIGDDSDHSWCSVSGVVPVDMSVTFSHFGGGPQLASAIVGEGMNGDWNIKYAEHESILEHHKHDRNELFLIERKVEPHSEDALLSNPYCFIFSPRSGDGTSWHVIFGQDIYAKVSLHCFLAATGVAKNTRSRLGSAEAIKWIAENYAGATEEIRKRLP